MMPFSVLRVWALGFLGWGMLALGAYCLWEWADGIEPPVVRREVEDPTTGQTTIVRDRAAEATRDRQGGWPYLAAGLGLLALSFGGGWPIVLFLGKSGTSAQKPREAASSKTVDRPDGSRLHLEFAGPKAGPTIVFTHGWSLDRTVWNELLQKLSDRYRTVVWDLPGLGHSKGPRNGDYRLEKMAADLEAVVQVAGKGPVILVGHSIGGMITQTYCRLYPKQLGTRVAGIVLLHTTYTNPLNTALFAPLWRAIEKPILLPLHYLTIWLAPLAWLSNWQSFANGNLHVITRIASFSGQQTWGQLNHGAWLAAAGWPAVVSRGNLAMLTFDEQRSLPAVEIPALVIAAQHDRMTKPEASERLARLLPNSREAMVAAGHLGLWEQPAEIAELITNFVDLHGEHDHAARQARSSAARS